MFPKGASVTMKQPIHIDNFIVKKLSVKPLKVAQNKSILTSIDFLQATKRFQASLFN